MERNVKGNDFGEIIRDFILNKLTLKILKCLNFILILAIKICWLYHFICYLTSLSSLKRHSIDFKFLLSLMMIQSSSCYPFICKLCLLPVFAIPVFYIAYWSCISHWYWAFFCQCVVSFCGNYSLPLIFINLNRYEGFICLLIILFYLFCLAVVVCSQSEFICLSLILKYFQKLILLILPPQPSFFSTLLCPALILFYSILFYSILFYSILFYSILFYSILFISFLANVRNCSL